MEKNLSSVKMVEDEDTAYDEVIQDIATLVRTHIKSKVARAMAIEKCRQLMRLMGDDDSEV